MINDNRQFVFVVCGAREHIDTIHFSLEALRAFSSIPAVIVTDSTRNEIPLRHHSIIDIKTPSEYNHHQASIYLKTGLHKFLYPGKSYCYLDTDVIALSSSVNEIFEQKKGIITFAPDHTRMKRFSPYAVYCGCLDRNKSEWSEFEELLQRFYPNRQQLPSSTEHKRQALQKKFEFIKRNKFDLWQMMMQYLIPVKKVQLDSDTFYNKQKHYWHDANGEVLLYDYPADVITKIEQNSRWRWSRLIRRWISPSGHDIHNLECDHLRQQIFKTFGIGVNHNNWQHWNGGVFLFDDKSHSFMEEWHQKTLSVFNNPSWKTRDQGTLIATVWQLGLEHTPTLSKHFNFIADFSNPRLMVSSNRHYITDDAYATKYAPAFIHIFNHFGEQQWPVWQWVIEILGTHNPAEPIVKSNAPNL